MTLISSSSNPELTPRTINHTIPRVLLTIYEMSSSPGTQWIIHS